MALFSSFPRHPVHPHVFNVKSKIQSQGGETKSTDHTEMKTVCVLYMIRLVGVSGNAEGVSVKGNHNNHRAGVSLGKLVLLLA